MDGDNYDSFSFHAKVTQRGNATDWHDLIIRGEFSSTWWTKDFNIHGPYASTAQDTYLMVFDQVAEVLRQRQPYTTEITTLGIRNICKSYRMLDTGMTYPLLLGIGITQIQVLQTLPQQMVKLPLSHLFPIITGQWVLV